MKTFRRLEDFPASYRNCVVSIGKFDGLHRGHAAILSKVVELARAKGAPAVVFTFEPSPARVLRPRSAPLLICNLEQKVELFESLGLDAVLFFPTTRDFLRRSSRDFFEDVLVNSLGAVALVEGNNFRFGSDQASLDLLEELCREHDVQLEITPPVQDEGSRVSSSLVRKLISTGNVERVQRLLARPFQIRGVVEPGDRRGRILGYPTANLLVSYASALPKPALYAASAQTADGSIYPAAVNLGDNPTFDVGENKIEAHLLGFSGDLYGQPLRLSFLQKLRDIVKFSSKEELIAQMKRDVEETLEIYARYSSRASE